MMPYGISWKEQQATTLKITVMATKINKNKHVWEGWTVGDFIEELKPQVANRNVPTGARTTSPITRNAYRT